MAFKSIKSASNAEPTPLYVGDVDVAFVADTPPKPFNSGSKLYPPMVSKEGYVYHKVPVDIAQWMIRDGRGRYKLLGKKFILVKHRLQIQSTEELPWEYKLLVTQKFDEDGNPAKDEDGELQYSRIHTWRQLTKAECE